MSMAGKPANRYIVKLDICVRLQQTRVYPLAFDREGNEMLGSRIDRGMGVNIAWSYTEHIRLHGH